MGTVAVVVVERTGNTIPNERVFKWIQKCIDVLNKMCSLEFWLHVIRYQYTDSKYNTVHTFGKLLQTELSTFDWSSLFNLIVRFICISTWHRFTHLCAKFLDCAIDTRDTWTIILDLSRIIDEYLNVCDLYHFL